MCRLYLCSSASSATLPTPHVNGSAATPTKELAKIDLLSGDLLGDDFGTPTAQDSLALVPVSAPQSSSPIASGSNALALVDMFSVNNTPDSSNSQTAFSSGHEQAYPLPQELQQQHNLQPGQQMPFSNGIATSMGLPQYEQAGYMQPLGASWNPQVSQQQQPPSSVYGYFLLYCSFLSHERDCKLVVDLCFGSKHISREGCKN